MEVRDQKEEVGNSWTSFTRTNYDDTKIRASKHHSFFPFQQTLLFVIFNVSFFSGGALHGNSGKRAWTYGQKLVESYYSCIFRSQRRNANRDAKYSCMCTKFVRVFQAYKEQIVAEFLSPCS